MNIKLSKAQLSKINQSGGLLGALLRLLMKVVLPLMKNVLTVLVKGVLKILGLPAAASAADTGIHKKILASATFASGTTTLIISNEEMKDITNTGKFLEVSGLLKKGVTWTYENITKKPKEVDFLICY